MNTILFTILCIVLISITYIICKTIKKPHEPFYQNNPVELLSINYKLPKDYAYFKLIGNLKGLNTTTQAKIFLPSYFSGQITQKKSTDIYLLTTNGNNNGGIKLNNAKKYNIFFSFYKDISWNISSGISMSGINIFINCYNDSNQLIKSHSKKLLLQNKTTILMLNIFCNVSNISYIEPTTSIDGGYINSRTTPPDTYAYIFIQEV
jgi:hypothetical protein